MDVIRRELIQTVRALRRSPGFTAVVLLVLALGIGANTAIYSVLNAVALKPLPYPDASRLVMLPSQHRPNPMGEEVSPANFLDWRRASRSFTHLGAFGPASLDLAGAGPPERLRAAQVTPGALAALGVQPAVGRLLLPNEERADSRVAILSFALWKSHFSGDPNVVGKVARFSGLEYPIVGVMPADFRFPSSEVQVWIPLRFTDERIRSRRSRWMYAVGRLAPGISVAAAQQEMDSITASLAREFPELNKDWGVRVVPMQEHLVGRFRPALVILLATVVLVLLISCANVANLQLARAAGRQTEMAIRAAMGASAAAVLRQVLLEGLVLSFCGGTLGVLLAQWSLRLLVASAPRYIPRVGEIGIDTRVLAFAFGVSLLTGVLFAIAPALSALKLDLVESLRGARGASSAPRQIRIRRAVTAAEVAAALVLLVGAALLLSSLDRLRRVEPGFDLEGVLTAEIVLPAARYPEGIKTSLFFRELVERAARIPGVAAAGGVSDVPLGGSNQTEGYFAEDHPPPDLSNLPEAGYRGATPGYFRAIGIRLLDGRDFSSRDTRDSPPVVVVNQTLARRHWPGERAVGKRLVFIGSGGRRSPHEVVGVVGDIHHTRLDVPTVPEIYVCYEQHDFNALSLVVRSNLSEPTLAAQLRRQVAAMDPEQPISSVRTMRRVLAESTSEPRFYAELLTTFAALALLLSTLGLYAVVSYSVARRRQEIGIRMALGARRTNVLALVVEEGMAVAAAGIVAGLLFAWVATRALSSLLFGVRPNDPVILAATAALIAAVTLAATAIPALRASRVDPLTALRAE